ncbi:hypothetical protein FGK63_11475 [Ruegeria sediminis]|uniref:GlcNAc-PI de-N-acetylase n=1 Tax=Ruegeria sediminis TaxID=2583820 RepID=A0ABY2WZX4_9RHOB|nr:PIG-L family deacetylase [Ruegeria sediminis]TMV08058.1 hypothetical protein FGK63_11475 [Ruegeria sediminis]
MELPTYEEVLASKSFENDLSQLNLAIAEGLSEQGEPVAKNGNVFFSHMQHRFHEAEFAPAMEGKRRAINLISREVECFAEVGVAGGHAALLALHSNPKLRYIGIDLGQRLMPSWPPVHIFVPIAFRWLERRFPDRVRLYMADSIDGLTQAVKENPFGPIGFLHLDAQKKNRYAEVRAAWPGLAKQCFLMQGDFVNGHVRESSDRLLSEGMARPVNRPEFAEIESRNYKVLEIGQKRASELSTLEALKNQRLLVCVAHQDDETLFCGSLLSRLKGHAEITVASFFRPAPNRRDTHTREATLRRVCEHLGAECIQYPFAVEQDHPRLRRFIRKPEQEGQGAVEIIRPLRRHPLFGALSETALATMKKCNPSIVITHNSVGEYGHLEHVLLHHAVLNAAGRYQASQVLTFGVGFAEADLKVPVAHDEKNKLFDEYLPQWDGRRRYDFAMYDESFIKMAVPQSD